MLCAFIFSAVRMTPEWYAALCQCQSSYLRCVLILNRARAPELHAGALFQVLKQLRQGMVKYMTVKRSVYCLKDSGLT